MKHLKGGAMLFIGIFAIVYIITSFVIWDLNAANWTENARYVVAIVGGVFGCAACVAYIAIKNV